MSEAGRLARGEKWFKLGKLDIKDFKLDSIMQAEADAYEESLEPVKVIVEEKKETKSKRKK